MKSRLAVCVASLALSFLATAETSSAADLTNLIRRPVQMINPFIPILDVSTAVPTTSDLLAFPVPGSRNRLMYPQQVLRYGLNVHPGARVARQNGLMLIEF